MNLRAPVFAVALMPALAIAAGPAHHQIAVRLEPGAATVTVHDRLTLPPEIDADAPVVVRLNAGFSPPEIVGARLVDSAPAGHDTLHRLSLRDAARAIELRYAGAPRLPQRAGPGEWFDGDGAHLGAAGSWYPRVFVAGRELFLTADLTVTVPAGWRALAPGRHADASGADRWVVERPVARLDLVAGPFTEFARDEPWGRSMVWLREADASLATTYLDAVGRDLPFYARLLGAYPYPKFAVVENLRQSGWGMPSFTLLGSRVMRLPFIPYTSLPHEVVHSWWGNAVDVDAVDGNWAEGLTAYLADHLRAQARGEGVRHRRDALARFRAAAGDGTALAPVRFVARHDRRSQSVGYDKPMMLFHMARRARGDAAFVDALRTLYRDGLGRAVGAREVLAALAPPGEDWFSAWWVRADAPRLELDCCELSEEAGAHTVSGTLRQVQRGAPFPLAVPVQVWLHGDAQAREYTVRVDGAEAPFTLRLPARPRMVAADAAFDLMRIPDRDELPPSLGELLDARSPVAVIAPGLSDEVAAACRELAAALGARVDDDTAGAGALWIFGPQSPAAAPWRDALEREIAHGDSRVLVAREDGGRPVAIVAPASAAATRALARKLPHYGRYGLLGFDGDGARNVFKDEQRPAGSPLRAVLEPGLSGAQMPIAARAALGGR